MIHAVKSMNLARKKWGKSTHRCPGIYFAEITVKSKRDGEGQNTRQDNTTQLIQDLTI
jgi:hypothetical protein